MKPAVIALIAGSLLSIAAAAQERDNDRRVDHDRYRNPNRFHEPRHEPSPAPKVGEANPYSTQGGRENPYATQGGQQNPYATQGGSPSSFPTQSGQRGGRAMEPETPQAPRRR